MNITDIFVQVLVLFILILVGYLCRKKDLLDESTTSKLSSMIMKVFLPAMIINSMQIQYTPDMTMKIISLLAISIIMYILSFVISLFVKYVFKSNDDIGIFQYVIVFSNVGFMGYPVVEAILGKEAVFYTAIFNLPFNLLIITLGSYLLRRDNSDYSFNLKGMINPVIISIFIGLIIFITNTTLPAFISKPISMLSNITTPLSMLMIGSMLYTSSARDCFSNKKLYILSLIRLIILPICLYLLLKNQVKDDLLLSIPIIIASMPAATNCAIMAKEYGNNFTLASQIVFLTTLLSIFTIPFISSILIL